MAFLSRFVHKREQALIKEVTRDKSGSHDKSGSYGHGIVTRA